MSDGRFVLDSLQHASDDYSWRDWRKDPGGTKVLWRRRHEILEQGLSTDLPLQTEWLALILELDRSSDDKWQEAHGGDIVESISSKQEQNSSNSQTKHQWSWLNLKGEAQAVAMLKRRAQMLTMALTEDETLQHEWICLMRALEVVNNNGRTAGNRSITSFFLFNPMLQ